MYILYICICKPHVYIDWCLHVHCIICQCLLYSIIAGIGNSLGVLTPLTSRKPCLLTHSSPKFEFYASNSSIAFEGW